jgi:hypothetical protein
MSADSGAELTKGEADSGQEEAERQPLEVAIGGPPQNPNGNADASGNPPYNFNYERIIAGGTLFVLFLTFLAALFAGIEADKLVIQTRKAAHQADKASIAALQKAEDANVNSEKIAEQQAKDTIVALGLSQKAAEAAETSANATIALERPYFFISDVEFVQDAGPLDPSPHIDFNYVNVGRVPGIVKLFYAECLVLKIIPAVPEVHLDKFRRADNAIGAGASLGSATSPAVLPKCTFKDPFTPELYESIKKGNDVVFFQSIILYEGALDFSYSRSVGLRYDPASANFYDVGATYNYSDQQKGRVVRPPPPTPKVLP